MIVAALWCLSTALCSAGYRACLLPVLVRLFRLLSNMASHSEHSFQLLLEGQASGGDFEKTVLMPLAATNLGAAAHAPHEPAAEYLRWALVAQAVRAFWPLVAPKLRDRPEAWPPARLPAPAEDAETPQ
eukprot:4448659-Amphidinium_carterae.1